MALYPRRKHATSPSILLVTVPDDQERYYRPDLINKHRSNREDKLPIPRMVGFHVNNLDLHDNSCSSFGWQRHSDKIGQITAAPDIAYRLTYLKDIKGRKSEKTNQLHSKSHPSFSYFPSESLQKQHSRTIYDYIHQSIRQIEQERNMKQENLSFRVPRPQNEDTTLRHVLRERKSSGRTSVSRCSSTTRQTHSSFFHTDLKSPESFVNYINHSRTLQSTTPDPSYDQQLSSSSICS